MNASPGRAERGSATVLVLVLITVLVFLTLAGSAVAALVVAQRRAQSAADLASLGGAEVLAGAGLSGSVGIGGLSPCGAVARVAAANGAEVLACAVQDMTVVVEVTVATVPLFGTRWQGLGRARAGPVDRPAWPSAGQDVERWLPGASGVAPG